MGGEAAVRLTLKYRVGHGVFGAALATDPGVFSWASLQSRGTAGYETSGYTGATQKSDDAAACKFEQRYYLSNVFAEDAALFEQFSYAQYLDQDGDSVLSHIDVRIRFVAGKDDKRHAEAVSQLGYVGMVFCCVDEDVGFIYVSLIKFHLSAMGCRSDVTEGTYAALEFPTKRCGSRIVDMTKVRYCRTFYFYFGQLLCRLLLLSSHDHSAGLQSRLHPHNTGCFRQLRLLGAIFQRSSVGQFHLMYVVLQYNNVRRLVAIDLGHLYRIGPHR